MNKNTFKLYVLMAFFAFKSSASYSLLVGEVNATSPACIPFISSNSTQLEQLDQVDLAVLQDPSEPYRLQEIAEFIWKRVPNWRELSKQAVFTAAVEVSLGDYIESIKNDESAKLFIRDLGLVPTLLWNVLSGEQVAGLKYVYDYNHVLAHGSKIALKVGGALVLINLVGVEPADAFKMSGYAGDSAGRLFIEKSRFEQEHQDSSEAFCWSSGLFSAITQVIPNNLIMYQVGDLFNKKFKLINKVQKISSYALNQLPGLPMADITKTYSQNIKISIPTSGPLRTGVIIAAKLVFAIASAKALNTVFLSPIGNSIMDGIKKAGNTFLGFFR